MEIIVLKNTPYKEKDAIIDALTSEGAKSFLVRGLLSPKSSNIVLSNPLVIADVEVAEGKYKHPVIKKSQVIHSPYHLDDNLRFYSVTQLIGEITLNLLQEEERGSIYEDLKRAIVALKDQPSITSSILLIYFMRVIKQAGYSFEAQHCVNCMSKKDIVTFSFSDGGFICKNCLTEGITSRLSKDAMLSIRKAIIASDYKEIVELSDDALKELLNELKTFVFDYLGVKITSIDLFS